MPAAFTNKVKLEEELPEVEKRRGKEQIISCLSVLEISLIVVSLNQSLYVKSVFLFYKVTLKAYILLRYLTIIPHFFLQEMMVSKLKALK